jgi:hypothetical protein
VTLPTPRREEQADPGPANTYAVEEVPDAAPRCTGSLLGAGAHTHPRHGGCLLELVSTPPGGARTDHPPRIDPVLGVLARAVNDATSSDQRPALGCWR